MTKTEVDRFRAVLTARVAELERVTRHRDAITIERSADQLDEIQAASQRALAVCKLDREFNQACRNRLYGWHLGYESRTYSLVRLTSPVSRTSNRKIFGFQTRLTTSNAYSLFRRNLSYASGWLHHELNRNCSICGEIMVKRQLDDQDTDDRA